MKNNKGQTLVIFVIILPILIILLATTIDIGFMYMEANKTDNINKLVLKFGLDNLNNENLSQNLEELVKMNDSEIKIVKLDIKDNKITLKLEKNIKSIFGKVIGLKTYKIVSNYEGILKENKKEITKG